MYWYDLSWEHEGLKIELKQIINSSEWANFIVKVGEMESQIQMYFKISKKIVHVDPIVLISRFAK